MTTLDPPAARRTNGLVALFTATIFLSAALLFFVQPLFARLVLPELGGAPAVWTTAMLFFQSVLLGGYLYAHLTTRLLPLRAQLLVHLTIWGLALFFLPLGVPDGWALDPTTPVAGQTLVLFAAGVGVPFALLSANAPLIQSWYAASAGPSADDPYFLYGASNLGSFAALLAFPLLAEPFFGAAGIGKGFAAGFVVLGAGLLATGLAAHAPNRSRISTPPIAIKAKSLVTWAVLAFVPSSLMLAVTTKISTDIGPLPLVWVIPLALYLLTFTLTFSARALVPERALWFAAIGSTFLAAASFLGLFGATLAPATAALLVATYFVIGLWSHRRLYTLRPAAENLTVFYITMSIGGAAGGLFNAILAPSLFDDLYEGAVTLTVVLVLLLPGQRALSRQTLLRAGLVVAVALGAVFATRPDDQIFRDRSFFGTHKVIEQNGLRLYTNGTTVHGAQRLSQIDRGRPEPVFYYHKNGTMGRTVAGADATARIGIIGQGVGSLACFSRPGQSWSFYEIDPMVDYVARGSGYFNFMEACAGQTPTYLGDARIVLDSQPDKRFDILVVDAFSSSAVPVHLMTAEAVALYMDRLAPDGLLLMHISNRYYDLSRPLGRIAAAAGLYAASRYDPGDYASDPGYSGSFVAAIASSEAAFRKLDGQPGWRPLVSDGGPIWTDDFANPLSMLKLGGGIGG